MSRKGDRCAPGHGTNRDGPGATKKRGGNKGILTAHRARKREEAEARNARYAAQKEQ